MAPNSENTSKTILEQARDAIHETVKTEKIEQQEKEATKTGIVKAAGSLTDKIGASSLKPGKPEPEGEPPKDNVVLDAVKIVSNDVSNQVEKAREKIYEATEPPASKK